MTDNTPLLTDNEIKTLAREAGCPVVTDRDGIMSFQAYGDNLRKFVAIVAERAAGAQPAPSVTESKCRNLLYSFMLDCNYVGIDQAAKNLHRALKEAARGIKEGA